ncbi:MAG: alpha-amylase family glycosyl hydrolase [bacterium]|nr:alpha-amylase family glycosyl hydrolase [bacterium]
MKRLARHLLTIAISLFAIVAFANTPEWIRGYPLYEVYIRSASPSGDFQGFQERLGSIRELGIQNLWLMPIFPLGIEGRKGTYGSPYAVRDYLIPNPEFGDSLAFRSLVAKSHGMQMRVILDWVANHSANDHILMKEHPDWWMKDANGNFTREVADWSDISDFNFAVPAMRQYMTDALHLWLIGYNVDGFRFDVAGMVPADYWKSALSSLRKEKPGALFLAEAYGDEYSSLGFHSMYDWPLYHSLKANVQGKIGADSLRSYLTAFELRTDSSFFVMRFLENHDEQRAVEAFGKEKLPAYIGLIFGLPGVPLLYNGQEIGATYKPSLFEKEPIDWNQVNIVLYTQYKNWIHWRNSLPSLRTGKLQWIETPEFVNEGLAFTRTEGNETSVVVTNLSDKAIDVTIPKTLPNGLTATKLREAIGMQLVDLDWKGTVTIRLQPWSARLLVAKP